MPYRHNGLLFEDNGAVNLLVASPPQNAVKNQGWARDAYGYGYVQFSGTTAYKHQGRAYTQDGALLVTGATPGAAGDYEDGYGALCNQHGYLYVGVPTGGRKHQGWLVNSNGSAGVNGFGFALPLKDKGSGEVDLVPAFAAGSATATFTRATTATTVDSTGTIVSVASGTPRSYYDPTTLEYMGGVFESARTNLCLQSADLATTWTNNASSESVNAAVAPDGTTTADKIIEDGTNAAHGVTQAQTFTNVIHTLSAFVKADTRSWVYLGTFDGTTTCRAWFNLATGVVGATSNSSSAIKAYPNGWYRCSMTTTAATAAAAGDFNIRMATGDSVTNYAGDSASGLFVWGAQLEAASFASTYIPTTTASVTRNADVLTYAFTDNASATAGTCLATLSTFYTVSASSNGISFSNAADGQQLGLASAQTSTQIVTRDGTSACTKSGLTDMSTGARKRGASWGTAGLASTGDGAAPATTAFDGTVGSTAIGIGNTSAGVGQWNGTIKDVMIYKHQIPDLAGAT